MSDRPITFSGPMVRALLAGTKTQTRRLCKVAIELQENGLYHIHNTHGGVVCTPATDIGREAAHYVAHQPGDRFYVREHWRTERLHLQNATSDSPLDDWPPRDLPRVPVIYEADADWSVNKTVGRFRQAMHMPKWASRITLHVTDVRVQRLHEIGDADAIAEGIELVRETEKWGKHWRNYGADGYDDRSAVYSYRTLWNSLRGHTGEKQLPVEPWSENPWVTATSFLVEGCNIGEAS